MLTLVLNRYHASDRTVASLIEPLSSAIDE